MNRLGKACAMMAATLLMASCGTQKETTTTYEKHLEFPKSMSFEEKVDLASRLVPTPQQLAWQKLEITAFIHFGINTFTDREWGDGTEDPALFNPEGLDTDQWCKELSEAGFKLVILTAKHHDGFCLWPTKTTEHSVASSPWREGKGDVVGDLAQSCRKYGLKLGLYLSPWDRNHPTYGAGEAYNKVYLEQLRELLTNYGEVDEVWFDGANGEGPNGKRQEYDWDAVVSLISELQPNAITAIMGRDVRWVGNERGLGRETEWSATVLPPSSLDKSKQIEEALGIDAVSQDLGSRAMLEEATELFWYPSEVDVSIRPGWFYHESEAPKSLEQLAHIYFSSVGMNSSLLLNIPPNREGRLDDKDVARLREFGHFVRDFNAQNAVVGFEPLTLEAGTYAEWELDEEQLISAVVLQEDIAKGQHVEHFELEAMIGNGWTKVGEGTTIGHKRIILSEAPFRASKLRLKLLESRGMAYIYSVSAHQVPEVTPTVDASQVTLIAKDGWQKVDGDGLTIDLGNTLMVNGFVYSPKGEGNKLMTHYDLSVSADGEHWDSAKSGEFGNIVNNPIPQYCKLSEPKEVRFVRLSGTNQAGTNIVAMVDEFDIF